MQNRKLEATITQFAVGQGGFLIGRIVQRDINKSREFTYAFDCGSINREHFEQGLDACSVQRIDVLFVSHLDLDHINGIDALAAKVKIDAVVLPCLDALQTIMLASECIYGHGVRESIVALLRNPAAWFGKRGVKKVYFQTRDIGRDESPIPESQRGQDSSDNESRNDFENDNRIPYQINKSRVPRNGSGDVFILDKSAVLQVGIPTNSSVSGVGVWMLVPYVHPFSAESLDAFIKAASCILKKISKSGEPATKAFTRKLLKVLRDETSRKKLKACYAVLSSDNNKPSMSLYSGPAFLSDDPERSLLVEKFRHHNFNNCQQLNQKEYGWLSTGDANLQSDETRSAWVTKYETHLASVAVFVLPHHGSNRHIHDDVIQRMPNATKVACAATKRPKHPHPALQQRLQIRGEEIVQVSELPKSSITLKVTL